MAVGENDLERMDQARLDMAARRELFETARECTFLFLDAEGWPGGVTMSHLFHDEVFWLTAVSGRAHVVGAESDPRVGLVISSLGTDLPGRRMVRVRGRATVHRDRATLDAVLPLFSARLQPAAPDRIHRLLNSANRVLIRVEPLSYPQTHDSRKISGDGRGGSAS